MFFASFSAGNSCVTGQTIDSVRPSQRLHQCRFSTCARTYQIQSGEKQFYVQDSLVSRSLFGVCSSPHTDIDVYSIKSNAWKKQLRWIYTVSVFRTFSSVFLRFYFSLKKYALFHPHFCKSIYALSRLLYIDKNFVQKFCVWTIRAVFRNRTVLLYKKIFSENFCPVCDCLVSADMDT